MDWLEGRATRRAAIAAGAGVAAAIRGAAAAASRSAVVVGAGVSGLKAAQDLAAAGYAVTVLEGDVRIGGRTWTVRGTADGLGAGVDVDLGAAWIHGTQRANPIWRVAQASGWRTVPTDWDDGTLHYQTGSGAVEATDAQIDGTWTTYRSVIRKARKVSNRQRRDESVQASLDRELARRSLGPLDEQLVRYWASSEIEYDYAGALSDLSAWWYDNDKYLGGESEAIVADGYVQLVDQLAAGLDIRTGAVVKRIDHDASGVTVTLRSGERLSAGAAVVTAPLGVLRAPESEAGLAFAPALPEGHRQAIAGLRMGALDKLFLRYERRFWDDLQVFSYASAVPGRWTETLNYVPIVGAPVLCAFNAGGYAVELEGKSDAQVVAEAQSVLRAIFGDRIPEPTGHVVTRWMRNPFSLGSYAHVPPGMNTTAYATLGTPAGPRLFLAGEHTIKDYPNTVHGAWLSGERAARQVRAALG